MSQQISAEALAALLEGNESFALIDVREAGEYNSTHIPGSSLIPRRELEFRIAASVPHRGAHVILCDDDGRRAALAAGTLEGLGYSNVSVLDRGINRWASLDYPTEWGVNVPSKDFGEKMEVVHHVPEIDATELHNRIERGDKLVILDTRTPEEYRRFSIPGGRSVPGGELALRITDITADLDPDTTVIVNCAGRTRSIIGTRVLQRMGRENVLGLKNGTSGWVLAGYELESGADRVDLPQPSAEGLAAAEAYADRLGRGGRSSLPGHPGPAGNDGAQQLGNRLFCGRAHRRRVHRRPYPRLPVVPRRAGGTAVRRGGGGPEHAHHLCLRRQGARHPDRLLVSATGPR